MAETADQTTPSVLVVQNARSGKLGRFEGWWRSAGLAPVIIKAYAGEPLPSLDDHDGLVMLGGGLMPDDDHRGPWLARERQLAEEALAGAVPVLGICLGGQLLAQVSGGTVRAKHGLPEAGSVRLTTRPEAATDPLFAALAPEFTAVEHHVDQITALPDDAVWLASSERCPIQAFRVGERAWGVQFHPEVGPDRVRAWTNERLRDKGFDPAAVLAQVVADEPKSEPRWRDFAGRFAAVVGARVRSDA